MAPVEMLPNFQGLLVVPNHVPCRSEGRMRLLKPLSLKKIDEMQETTWVDTSLRVLTIDPGEIYAGLLEWSTPTFLLQVPEAFVYFG